VVSLFKGDFRSTWIWSSKLTNLWWRESFVCLKRWRSSNR